MSNVPTASTIRWTQITAASICTIALFALAGFALQPTAALPSFAAPSTVAETGVQDPASVITAADDSLRLALIGDVRTEGREPPRVFSRVADLVAEAEADTLLSVGDLINANHGASPDEQWRALRQAVQPTGAQRFLPCLGNHDTNGSAQALSPFRALFDLPLNGPPGLEELAYSVDEGPVHLVCVATEQPGQEHALGETQLAWLERDLEQTSAPYVLVFGHDPAFPVGPHIGGSLDRYPDQRDQFWRLLQRHTVTAYLAGHEHLYHRHVVDGLTEVILGSSGSDVKKGYGGDFVGFALFVVTETELQVLVTDVDGQVRDQFALPRR